MTSATEKTYLALCQHYESCFEREGDTHKGVDWPVLKDTLVRYHVMSGIFSLYTDAHVLDIGCGLAHYLDYLKKNEIYKNIRYVGLDISEKLVEHCRKKHPDNLFIQHDLVQKKLDIKVDFCILNGLFTVKNDLSHAEMFDFMKKIIKEAFYLCKIGLAFNVMSKNVDWERDDLFHVSMDELSAFISRELSRNFVIRNDYGLYEYTVYVYHQPLEVL